MKNRFRRKVLYRLVLWVRFLFRKLPSSWGIAFGDSLGRASFWVLRKERRKTLEHLSVAFSGEKSPKEIFEIGKSVFQNLGKTAAELIYFPRITQRTIDRWVSFDGLSKLDKILKAGKGGIILVAHFGNWELLARALSLKGYSGIIVARKVYDERFDRLLNEIRQSEGLTYLYRDESPKEMLRILHQNRFLGILADQDIDSVDGIFVPFFGRDAYTPVGPARFSIASGAPIVPCFMVRAEDGRHRLVVEDPIRVPDGLRKDEAVGHLTKAWMAVTESYVRRFPDHWVWMHRRWKTEPESVKRKAENDNLKLKIFSFEFWFCVLHSTLFASSLVVTPISHAEEIVPEQEVHAFSFTGYSKEGKREWEVQGASAVLKGDVATLEKPVLATEGKTTMTVTSERGTYDRHTAKAHLEQNVFARTSDGATLRTDSLDWHGPTKRITTEDQVMIERESFVSQGKGAEAYPDLKKLELKEAVTVDVAPDIQITSAGPMELDYSQNIAIFRDQVRVIDEEGEILADRMDVYFEPETSRVREIIATGNVRIKRGGSLSYSEKATYDAMQRKVTLVGRPKLFIQPEEAGRGDDAPVTDRPSQ